MLERLLDRLTPATLTKRIFAVYTAALLLFVAGGLAAFISYEFRKQIEDTQASSVMLMEVVAQSVQDSVVIGDYDTLKRILDKGVQGSVFASAMFKDTAGASVVATSRTARTGTSPALIADWVRLQLDDVNRPVTVGGMDYGMLRLQYDADQVAQDLWEVSVTVLGVGLAALVSGLLLIRWALNHWLGGLEKLRKVVQTLGTDGTDTETLVIDGAPAEIQSLVDMFNQTALLVREREAGRAALEQAKLAAERARHTAEQANLAKSQFLANMSHELRTPMNAILGMLQLLQGTELSDKQRGYTHNTTSAARSLLSLLNDILDFSKVEAGKMTLDPRPFHVDQLMRDLSVILSANVVEKTIEVLFDIDPAVPPTLVGDDMRLQQVLINLGGNAIKFTESGEVVVGLRLLERSEGEALLEFSVADSGIGIAEENFSRIFSGFSQAEASTTRRFGGTGLGLAICQRLVGLMGGTLEVTSTPGTGSRFQFAVPLQIPAGGAQAPELCEAAPLAGQKTLLVDDNPVARSLLTAMLRPLGCNPDVAPDGAQALALLQSAQKAGAPYQLVFMDWRMPGWDGWETTRRIRQAITHNAPLIIMVSANARAMVTDRSPEDRAQINGFLVKPATASMLLDVVAQARTAAAGPVSGAAVKTRPQRLSALRLLVAEDNKINQLVAKGLLEQEGAQVTLAGNGRIAVDLLLEKPGMFDAVLMDLQMPEMDGYEATRTLRTLPGLDTLPVIAMTANAMASDREACLAAGMDEHVGKPFEIDHLVRTLLRFCGTAAGL